MKGDDLECSVVTGIWKSRTSVLLKSGQWRSVFQPSGTSSIHEYTMYPVSLEDRRRP
jgi:hypothetical protein